MEQATLVNHIRVTAAQLLKLIEQAQALAAAQTQEWVKVGGETFMTGFDYTDMDIDAADTASAMSTMQTFMPDVLAAHGTNLYKIKS